MHRDSPRTETGVRSALRSEHMERFKKRSRQGLRPQRRKPASEGRGWEQGRPGMVLWGRARAQTGSSGTMRTLPGTLGSEGAGIPARLSAGVIRLGPKSEAPPHARARVVSGSLSGRAQG